MQLKVRRSQRETMLGGNARFQLAARASFTEEEHDAIHRYKLGSLLVYQSERAKQHVAAFITRPGAGTPGGDFRALGHLALAAMNINIRIRDLESGVSLECKTLDEVIGAEEAVMEACENLHGYLETAKTFDGREAVISFDGGEPKIVGWIQAPARPLALPSGAEDGSGPPILPGGASSGAPEILPAPIDQVAHATRRALGGLSKGARRAFVIGAAIVVVAAIAAYFFITSQPYDPYS